MKELVIYNYSFLIEDAMLTLTAGRQNKLWFARLILRDKTVEVSFDSNVCFFSKNVLILGDNRFSKDFIDCDLSFSGGLKLAARGNIISKTVLPNAMGIIGALGLYRCNFDVFALEGLFSGVFLLNGKDYGLSITVSCNLNKGEGVLSNYVVITSPGLFFSAGSNRLMDLELSYRTAGLRVMNRVIKFSKLNSRIQLFEDNGSYIQVNIASKNATLNIFTALDGEYTDNNGVRRSVLAKTRYRLIENGKAFEQRDLSTYTRICGLEKARSPELKADGEQAKKVVELV